jgi:hypothetical protein
VCCVLVRKAHRVVTAHVHTGRVVLRSVLQHRASHFALRVG